MSDMVQEWRLRTRYRRHRARTDLIAATANCRGMCPLPYSGAGRNDDEPSRAKAKPSEMKSGAPAQRQCGSCCRQRMRHDRSFCFSLKTRMRRAFGVMPSRAASPCLESR